LLNLNNLFEVSLVASRILTILFKSSLIALITTLLRNEVTTEVSSSLIISLSRRSIPIIRFPIIILVIIATVVLIAVILLITLPISLSSS